MTEQRCEAEVFPTWANCWLPCNSPIIAGRCIKYGHAIATIRPTSTPDAVVRVSTTPDTFGTAERRTRR